MAKTASKFEVDGGESLTGMQALLEKNAKVNASKAPVQLESREVKKLRVARLSKKRPVTPEEKKLKCLDCESMRDFIAGLQGEVKRL